MARLDGWRLLTPSTSCESQGDSKLLQRALNYRPHLLPSPISLPPHPASSISTYNPCPSPFFYWPYCYFLEPSYNINIALNFPAEPVRAWCEGLPLYCQPAGWPTGTASTTCRTCLTEKRGIERLMIRFIYQEGKKWCTFTFHQRQCAWKIIAQTFRTSTHSASFWESCASS